MLKQCLKIWVRSGIARYPHEYFTPVRLTNIIAFLIIVVSCCQIPGALWFWQDTGSSQFVISSVSIVLLCLVPLLNHQAKYTFAKIVLISIYIANLLATSWLWEINLYIHFFYLLAVVCCPFFFIETESRLKWFYSMLFIILFMSTEIYYQLFDLQDHTAAQQLFKFSSACLLALACVLCSYHIQKNVARSWHKLALEKKRSEQLLLNILPNSIAQRLKNSTNLIADYFAQASILFADIQNFTPLCKRMDPQKLVSLLNELFCQFDVLAQHYGLEKIKTNGDSYMAACGLPNANAQHAIQCCECALDMQDEFERFSEAHKLQTGLRIGIGCGEVVAGVIGKNKFSYDMWGEAVNLASRMQSHGESHKIQTTQATFELTRHLFNFIERGQIEVKGVGQVTTYWLISRKY
ncbi:adenylate/guanylate cyclase domain-containing protein [Paraglaciecola hydrolytica]|uniref:Adenylate cyclase n=1 Tax=Paraglaciecola hydrolytica TaxID=1799789 RepID=A0A136A3V2_9ALTE|nr:adenylate/guanylate cyclase domain-containing protein [Paraglaciecola hydrolytica]KXI29915.1 adenylate cyclase [Paraglaciecola hydrolytica]